MCHLVRIDVTYKKGLIAHVHARPLLHQRSVRVDFFQEETTSNPILRQKVRLLALTKAIRRVNEERLPQTVLMSPCSFVVDWKTKVSIYFGEEHGREELNRCSIHVTCAAHRSVLWESWSAEKKFTLLSKAALCKSFANQCARLSRASVYLQSLKMRRILLKMAREKDAALAIQRFWKKHTEEVPEKRYLREARQSCVRLQSWWRMLRCIQQLQLQDAAALIIQALIRGSSARAYYSRSLRSATVLQSFIRRQLQRSLGRHQWAMAIELQRSFRGFLARSLLLDQDFAASAIQSWFRAVALRRCFWKTRRNYLTLQLLVAREQELHKMQMEKSASQIQTWWRMRMCRLALYQELQSVSILQAAYRAYRIRKTIKAAFKAVTVIQAHLRGIQLRSAQELCKKKRELGALQLQSWWRMEMCKLVVWEELQYVSILQAAYRGHHTRKKFRAAFQGVTVIQAHFRGIQVRSAQELRKGKREQCAVQLQSWWRMEMCKLTLWEELQSVTVVQAAFRGHNTRKRIRAAFRAVTAIQAYFRGIQLRSAQELHKRKREQSAVKLQSWWKMEMCKLAFWEELQSVSILQAAYRGHHARKTVAAALRAVTVIQAHFRDIQLRSVQELNKGKREQSAVRLQSWWRMRMCKLDVWVELHPYVSAGQAASAVQAAYRGHHKRKTTRAALRAVTTIQAHFRGIQLRSAQEFCKRKQEQCAVSLQAWWRMEMCKVTLWEELQSVTVVQAAYRGHRTRKTIRSGFRAVTTIQAHFRGIQLRSAHELHKRKREQGAKRLQCWWRMGMYKLSLGEQLQSVSVLQAVYRGYHTRKAVNAAVRAVAALQALYRGNKSRSMHSLRLRSSIAISHAWKQYQERQHFQSLKQSSIIVQNIVRGYQARKIYQSLLEAHLKALVIQLAWDSYLEKKAAGLYQAIVLVQKVYRGHHVRRIRGEVKKIQRFVRQYLVRKQKLTERRIQASVLMIQASYRGFSIRRSLQARHGASIVIQTWYQARKAEIYSLEVHAAIQERISSNSSRRQDILISDSSVSLHDIGEWSGSLDVKKEYQLCSVLTFPENNKRELSAMFIQSWYRIVMSRKIYGQQKSAIISIQRAWRYFLRREGTVFTRALVHDNAIEVERTFRPCQVFSWLKKVRVSPAIGVEASSSVFHLLC